MEYTVVRGDIAEQSADALVNAAGTSLRMGSGVAGALLEAADGPLEEAARAKGPVDLGGVAVTDAFGLDADYVVHAASMSHRGPHPRATEEGVRRATRNALGTAEELGCESLALPMLGCGSGGVYLREGAAVIHDAIRSHEARQLEDVRVVVYTARAATAMERAGDEEA